MYFLQWSRAVDNWLIIESRVKDNEIDYDAIAKVCENGIGNARAKAIRYAGVNRWDGFKNGLCAIT